MIASMTERVEVGDIIHGFAGGAFGRDSYACRRVEAVGADWIVTRNNSGAVEFAAGDSFPSKAEAADRRYCDEGRCHYVEDPQREHPDLHDFVASPYMDDPHCVKFGCIEERDHPVHRRVARGCGR